MAATNPPFFLLKIATSDQGWTNNEIFAQWFTQVFIPFVQGHNKSGTPILLIIDGHTLHETTEVQQLCWKYTGQVGTVSLYFGSPHKHLWVCVDSSPPLSHLTPTLSATEVSHLITTQKPSLTCIVPES